MDTLGEIDLGAPRRSRSLYPRSLRLHDMQAAFLFGLARPAAGAFVLADADGLGAWPTADAGIALVMQWVVRNVVVQNELPHIPFGPTEQRVDLHEIEFAVPLHHAGGGAML